jgi:hypothetical protein
MTVPIYIVALVIAVSVGWNADRTGQKAYHLMGACCLGVLSFIICLAVKNTSVRYVHTHDLQLMCNQIRIHLFRRCWYLDGRPHPTQLDSHHV